MDFLPHYVPQEVIEDALRKKRLQRKKRKRKGCRQLPHKILVVPNRDKKFHEKWYEGRDLLDFPHPFRMVLASKPNGGKTTVALNVIMRVGAGKTPFEKIIVVHCDPEETKEYLDIDCEMMAEIPSPQEFSPDQKTLVILEDLNYMDMDKTQQGRLERLYGYVSTHKNISCMLTAQDPFRIIPTVRRCTNIFVIWNNHDVAMVKCLARKTGVDADRLVQTFNAKCPSHHDSIWIDFTTNTPAPWRRNGYEIFLLE